MQLLPGNIELSSNPAEKTTWDYLKAIVAHKDGILGYKIPALGNKNLDDIPSFVLRSITHGIVVIDIVGDKVVDFEEDGRFWIKSDGEDLVSRDILVSNFCRDLENKLSKSTILYDYEKEVFNAPSLVKRLLVFTSNSNEEIVTLQKSNKRLISNFISKDEIKKELTSFLDSKKLETPLTSTFIDEIDSILDGTSVFNKRKKRISQDTPSRNELIKKSLSLTFKLDATQRSVALQVPNGPQRIRGLAGTGKTVILSMKAALTHISNRNRNFKILFVFNTQSMYNHIVGN